MPSGPHPPPAPHSWRCAPRCQALIRGLPPRPSARDLGPAPVSPRPASRPPPAPQLLCHFLIPASCFPETGIRSHPRTVLQPPGVPGERDGPGLGTQAEGWAGLRGQRPRGLEWGSRVQGTLPLRGAPPSDPTPLGRSASPLLGRDPLKLRPWLTLDPAPRALWDALWPEPAFRLPTRPARPPAPAWGSLHIPAGTAHSVGPRTGASRGPTAETIPGSSVLPITLLPIPGLQRARWETTRTH